MPKTKSKQSEIRKDYFLNKYVIITPGRAKRAFDIKEKSVVEKKEFCYFCPENVDKNNIKDEIKVGKNWQVLSLGNLFPAVSQNNNKAYGVQEVLVETPNHSKELAELSEKEIIMLLKMYIKRTREISEDKKIEYILCFKNHGAKAGASKIHSHSQIFATNILPPEVENELHEARLYKTEHGSCPFCDIIKKEAKSPRKIYSDKYIVALAPYASQFHYEAWIFSRRHLDNITRLNEDEIKSFAKALKKILWKLHQIGLSYNFFLHQVVSDNEQHFYLKIQPRDSIWAGVELGSGIVINSISPEEAAKYYSK